jgi:hypothetical protein
MDLALFGTHGSEIFFTAAARVHIQHGLGAGKLVDGQDYTYGPKWALWDGTPTYDRMLEASHAVAACPRWWRNGMALSSASRGCGTPNRGPARGSRAAGGWRRAGWQFILVIAAVRSRGT